MHITPKTLEQFAEILLKVGLNVQKGDKLNLMVTAETLPYIRYIDQVAWKMGVTDIVHRFSDDELTLNFYKYASDEALDYFPDFKVEYREAMYKAKYHTLSLVDVNPTLLKDIEPARLGRRQKLVSAKQKHLMEYPMQNKVKWCVAVIPSQTWAEAVLPGQTDNLEKLTEEWLKIYRLDRENPLAAWEEHNTNLKRHENWLNEQRFDHLLYKAPGTNLKVRLPEGHRWIGGSGVSQDGCVFMANVPTEEIFSMPHKYGVDGTLAATLPLSLHGHLIEGMHFTFENGRCTSYKADKGQEVLDELFKTDANSLHLGEVAIVPVESPIYQSGLIFQETLFDENASCHFAFGNAYSETLPGSENYSEEEMDRAGMNDSMIHVDFMVGSPELSITGVKQDGTEVPVLVNGHWAEHA